MLRFGHCALVVPDYKSTLFGVSLLVLRSFGRVKAEYDLTTLQQGMLAEIWNNIQMGLHSDLWLIIFKIYYR